MTNTQLLLSIGIQSLLILVSWVTNNTRFDRIEKRLDGHDARFDRMDDKFSAKIDGLQSANHKDALEILRQLTAVHERIAVVEEKQRAS